MANSELDANQVIQAVYNQTDNALQVSGITGSFINTPFDEIALTYIPSGNGAGQIGTAVYKLSGVTQATLTLTYDGSNNLIDVLRS